jgi:hypothetical protein
MFMCGVLDCQRVELELLTDLCQIVFLWILKIEPEDGGGIFFDFAYLF